MSADAARLRSCPPEDALEFLVIFVLVLLNGLFSGAEIAILSVRKTRLVELCEAGSTRARSVVELRDHPERFLATVQIGITVLGVAAAAFSGATLADDLSPWIAKIPLLGPASTQVALAVIVATVSYVSLVFGELIPKSIALRMSESYALAAGPVLLALAWVARPLVFLLTGTSNLLLRVFGDRTSFVEARLSREELQQLVGEAATAGSFDSHAGEIASRALGFDALDVSSVMVPRTRVIQVHADTPIAEVARLTRENSHARLPIFDKDPDDVIGYVNVRELLAEAQGDVATTLRKLIRPVIYIPETLHAPDALRALQQAHSHLALVVDEQGGVRGLLTMEDLIEELVGEMLSEGDSPAERIRREDDGSMLVPGETPIHELSRALGVDLEDTDAATLAGLVLEKAGRIPEVGAHFEAGRLKLEVVDATARRVRIVRVRVTG